jgi:hypothetical protein
MGEGHLCEAPETFVSDRAQGCGSAVVAPPAPSPAGREHLAPHVQQETRCVAGSDIPTASRFSWCAPCSSPFGFFFLAAAKPTMSTTVKTPMPTQLTSGGTPRFHESAALRRAENIAPRAGRTAIAFGPACDRRVFASTKSSTVSRSRELGGRSTISRSIGDFAGRSTISAHRITPAGERS